MTLKYAGTTVSRHNEKTQCRETEQSHQTNQSPPATPKAANGAARGPLSASSACTPTQTSHGGEAAPRRPKGPLSASKAYTPSAKSAAATDGGHCPPLPCVLNLAKDCYSLPKDCCSLPKDCYSLSKDCYSLSKDCYSLSVYGRGHCPSLSVFSTSLLAGQE